MDSRVSGGERVRLLRRAIDGGSRVLGRIKRGQRVRPPAGESPVRVNLGCGLAVAPGWFNVDGSLNALIAGMPRAVHKLVYRHTGASRYYAQAEYLALLQCGTFIHHDLQYGIPLHDATADFVYSSHFLEHMSRVDALHLLRESFRVLKPGGVVRVVVPDLEYAVSLYAQGRKEDMLTQYFFVEDDDSYYARHKYMYDYESLAAQLLAIGFKDIQRQSFQSGKTPDLKVLDNRPDDSLYVEAMR